MILSYVALALAVLAIILIVVGQLLDRRWKAHAARTERTLAAAARWQGQHEQAGRHERRAAVYEESAWPFRVPPQTVFEIPGGLVTVDENLTDEQVAEMAERWRQQYADLQQAEVVYRIGTETTSDTGMWWRKLRHRVARLATRSRRNP